MNPAPGQAELGLVQACLRQPVSRTPVWFMRQAGRSLPEYRAARGEGSILSAIADPALSAELTLQPVRRYGVDAAILFSDIVVPVHPIGFGIDVEPGRGPVVAEAEARGGNAVLAMRFDTSEMGGNWTEICAYGTAAVIEPQG